MLRSAILLLCCSFCTLLHGQEVLLPSTITAKGKLVLVSPEYKSTPKAVDFVVLGLKTVPEYASLGNSVLVAEPDQGDEYTVIAFAVFEGYKTAKAVTVVKPRSGSGTNPDAGTTPPSVPAGDRDIPAGVSKIHAVLVIDVSKPVPADLSALSNAPNTLTRVLGERGSYWYVRAHTDSLATRFSKELQGKTLPALVVLDASSGTAKVVSVVSIQPTGDTEKTARSIITAIANAVSK